MVERRRLREDLVDSVQPPQTGERWVADTAVRRACGGVLRSPWVGRAVHQGRQERSSVDPADMPEVPQQRGSVPASRPGLKSGQLHADAGLAEGSVPPIADDATGAAGEDRREGGRSRAVRHLPIDRAVAVPSNLFREIPRLIDGLRRSPPIPASTRERLRRWRNERDVRITRIQAQSGRRRRSGCRILYHAARNSFQRSPRRHQRLSSNPIRGVIWGMSERPF